MTDKPAEFVRTLAQGVPELQPLLREHEADYKELLPHVFMGDVTRFVFDLHSRAQRGSRETEGVLTEILVGVEKALASRDLSLRDLIVASFLENLDRSDPLFGTLRDRFGKTLLAALDFQDRPETGSRRRDSPRGRSPGSRRRGS